MSSLTIRYYTDPACPWAFSAEPARWSLRWLYGEEIDWRPRMVVLSESPDDYLAKDFTSARQSQALHTIQRRFGMPIDPGERPRMMATVVPCRAVVAARLHAPAHERALLRRLAVRAMAGELIDEPEVIASSAGEVGLEPGRVSGWMDDPAVEGALRSDAAAARDPAEAALALDHKLADSEDGRRYTCPSYEISRDGSELALPGFQPLATYEAAIANLAPELERRATPESVEEVLAWAGEPLATAEVAAVCGIDVLEARERLARVAHGTPVGADGYWTLRA
ncbi:MAG: hypothetical protein AVDCRST_MAG45-2263 [uncultured Solirubrobacterales bacterium]|uniref:DSBA-like thioredoxin domain-containing protein n=1 Tax=uncultured Solirubrobacterales bacterium TaxID=768556 RepID=A0A6J4T8Y7_9ACTN|nr:MAG: hypothetical protein AVDCRST_MAG45-2263 [uncultured Solirubrobacterales bacterium]